MDRVLWALPLLFIFTHEGLFSSSTSTSTSTTSRPSSSSSPSSQGETKNIHFKLTSKDPDATIEIQRLVVSEKKGGKEVDEYIIDLTENKVFLDKDPQSRNLLEVKKSSDPGFFTVDSMSCGGKISAPCGFIQLPKNYHPGLICEWTIPDMNYTYSIDPLTVGTDDTLIVNGKTVANGEGKTPTVLPSGSSTIVNFESGVKSKGESQMRFSFKTQTVETKPKPQDSPGKCCPFYFKEDTLDGLSLPIKKKLGGKAIFEFEKMEDVGDTQVAAFSRKGIRIVQKYHELGNYWSIEEDSETLGVYQNLEKGAKVQCPTERMGWSFTREIPDMMAICASKAELEADEKANGLCTEIDHWSLN